MCTAVNEWCTATKDEDCQQSEMCKGDGECTAVNGRCQAKKAEDCLRSSGCLKYGECTAVNGKCEKRSFLNLGASSP